MKTNYTKELEKAIHIAKALAKEYQNQQFSPAHLLLGLLHNEVKLLSLIHFLDKDVHYLRDWAEYRVESSTKVSKIIGEPVEDKQVKKVMQEAEYIRIRLSEKEIKPSFVLAAICKPNIGFTSSQLKTLSLSFAEIESILFQQENIAEGGGHNNTILLTTKDGKKIVTTSFANLEKYCTSRTDLAKEGKVDPIIAREGKIREIADILGRRRKPNVIIVGEPGVGKTALVDGFATCIVEDRVPSYLKDANILELNIGTLVAGASYRGEIEDRLKNVLNEVKQCDKAIIFIDEIHVLLDDSMGLAGAANLLKPELARGEITLIGTTTHEEYRKYIEKNEAFARRFEKLIIEEPDVNSAVKMIERLLPTYEEHHGIKCPNEVVLEVVKLAKRYVRDRRLPDSAIDILDRAMGAIHNMNDVAKSEIEAWQTKFETWKTTHKGEAPIPYLSELKRFYERIKRSTSPLLFSRLETEEDIVTIITADLMEQHVSDILEQLIALASVRKEAVDKSDVAIVIAKKTDIPLGKIKANERERLLKMEDHLRKRVIGQNHALTTISEAILMSRAGLTDPNQPVGSFFFLGPTGVGKTELAKSLAAFLFNDENAIIRFDMSEFKEKQSASLLLGASPGYVGYEEGGLLVRRIRQKPYSIVLFDEIEKAHHDVFDVFLPLLDEGKITDKLGKEGDFSNAIILFTSNIGSSDIVQQFMTKNTLPKSKDLVQEMKRHFRPEFLGRLTGIIPFAPITKNNIVKIFEIHCRKLIKTLKAKGITLNLSKEASNFIAHQGFTPEFGARPLKGAIKEYLHKPLSKKIIAGEVTKGSFVDVEIAGNELVFKVKQEELVSS